GLDKNEQEFLYAAEETRPVIRSRVLRVVVLKDIVSDLVSRLACCNHPALKLAILGKPSTLPENSFKCSEGFGEQVILTGSSLLSVDTDSTGRLCCKQE